MNALIFGGMSPRHKEWVRQVAENLEPHIDDVRLLDYRHWATPGVEMDLEYEIAQASKLAEGWNDYVVVAKSIGTVMTMLATARQLLSPAYCVFMGLPLNVIEADIPEVARAMPQLPPTHFIHNENDPLGSADSVKNYIEAHAPERYDLLVTPGDTHDYLDFKLITDLALG